MLKRLLSEALLKAYRANPEKEIILQFSAGCDSTALFFSMLDMKEKYPFRCVTYYYKQPQIYLNKINKMTSQHKIPLKVFALSDSQVEDNYRKLIEKGFSGKVLLDCLVGHVPICEYVSNSIIINGSYADVLYGSYFYIFRPPITQEEFNEKRLELLRKPDQDGVQSLTKLLDENKNVLVTPFLSKKVVEFFLTKSFEECGGTTKKLFRKEFESELKTVPYKINRMAQQIESGIRDYRKYKMAK
jgi:asparagine synthetase B (glutamine-hydrolysing)